MIKINISYQAISVANMFNKLQQITQQKIYLQNTAKCNAVACVNKYV